MGFVPFTFVDFIDIILVAVIMYWIYRMTKGTNAPYILSGIIAIYLLWVVVRTLNMELPVSYTHLTLPTNSRV